MRERPIIFSAPMVRAILDGRKTQTRRLVKLPEFQPSDTPGYVWSFRDKRGLWNEYKSTQDLSARRCPYGAPGDRLWVRETWGTEIELYERMPPRFIGERAAFVYREEDPDFPCKWRPSIHMPSWASRITLEVVGVRVERLGEISQTDAIAEGATSMDYRTWAGNDHHRSGWSMDWSRLGTPTNYNKSMLCDVQDICLGSPQHAFGNYWESIHGPESWDASPWVWVVEFRRA